MRPTKIERETEWYIYTLEFMGEKAPIVSSNEEATTSNEDKDIDWTHPTNFESLL